MRCLHVNAVVKTFKNIQFICKMITQFRVSHDTLSLIFNCVSEKRKNDKKKTQIELKIKFTTLKLEKFIETILDLTVEDKFLNLNLQKGNRYKIWIWETNTMERKTMCLKAVLCSAMMRLQTGNITKSIKVKQMSGKLI